MRNLIVLIPLFALLAGCATQKHTVDTDTDTASESKVKTKTKETRQTETITYGDSLKGTGFIPADGSAGITAESKGIKLQMKLKPKYGDDGKLQGYNTEYQGTAKPVKTEKKSVQQQIATKAQHSTRKQEKVADQQTTKQGSWTAWLATGAGLMLFLILGLTWLYNKIKNGKGI